MSPTYPAVATRLHRRIRRRRRANVTLHQMDLPTRPIFDPWRFRYSSPLRARRALAGALHKYRLIRLPVWVTALLGVVVGGLAYALDAVREEP